MPTAFLLWRRQCPRAQPDGYLAVPASGNGAPVLVLHAWWGLNDTMRAFCTRLADAGLLVFAPDLYHGKVADNIADAERLGSAAGELPSLSWHQPLVLRTRPPASLHPPGGEPGVGANVGVPEAFIHLVSSAARALVGHVDNSRYPELSVNIQASVTVPAEASGPVPVMVLFGGGFGFGRRPTTGPATEARSATRPSWQDQAIAHGWGYATINPNSIQPDNDRLTSGIIGLTNKGLPRTPEQWGALRAWQWGVSRLIDCFEQHPEWKVDAKRVGIAGLSRYGKAAIVIEAFDTRIAVGLIGSPGEGGTKLHRHIFGEAVENLAGGEYYWMAGNFIKYGAADPPKTAADLPVDSHELIALCAPRPCFISHGIVERGDAKWIDAHGSFMAAVLASPVYELLGAKGLGTPGNYLTDPMPPVGQLIGGQLAWRQHEGGHDLTPNWPAFFEWVGRYIPAHK
jgi:hypothetical protein